MALSRVLLEGDGSKRIDVVFDVYREWCIKSIERAQRGEGDAITFKNLAEGHKVSHLRSFLQNGHSKNSLIKFFLDHWSKEGRRQKLLDKVLYVTSGSRCFQLTVEFPREGELGLNQEEADTRPILHAGHAAKQPFKSIIVSSEDTDV